MHFGVIGAGVVGLTTALELQEEFPNCNVTVFADKFLNETTSHVAAGVFRPGTSFMGPTIEITKKWINDAYNHWDNLRKSSDASSAGVCEISSYFFSMISKSQTRNHYIKDIVPIYRDVTEDELSLCEGNWKYGSFFQTLLIENGLYLPYATQKFKLNNGKIIERHINSFAELNNNEFDVIVNCTGLGAQELCSDIKLVPIRGQILKVQAPWIKTAFYGDLDTYIIPGFNGVTLGGTRNYDSYNLNVSKYDSLAIRERCFNMLPSLKKAKILHESVGLRPHRTPVRVEFDYYQLQCGNYMKIVHNYGHGGYGVTTSPGTAKHAILQLRTMLTSSSYLMSKL